MLNFEPEPPLTFSGPLADLQLVCFQFRDCHALYSLARGYLLAEGKDLTILEENAVPIYNVSLALEQVLAGNAENFEDEAVIAWLKMKARPSGQPVPDNSVIDMAQRHRRKLAGTMLAVTFAQLGNGTDDGYRGETYRQEEPLLVRVTDEPLHDNDLAWNRGTLDTFWNVEVLPGQLPEGTYVSWIDGPTYHFNDDGKSLKSVQIETWSGDWVKEFDEIYLRTSGNIARVALMPSLDGDKFGKKFDEVMYRADDCKVIKFLCTDSPSFSVVHEQIVLTCKERSHVVARSLDRVQAEAWCNNANEKLNP